MIENVQRRFTKAIFPKLTYPVRLSRLGLQKNTVDASATNSRRFNYLLQVDEQFN